MTRRTTARAAALAVAALAAGAAAAYPTAPVFASYHAGGASSNCFRQPILIPLPGGALVAFAEGRNITYCAGTEWPDAPDFPIVVKRSDDGGATWAPPGDGVEIMRGNLDFLTSVLDPATGVLHLTVQLGDAGAVYTRSTDGGRTWAPPANLTVRGATSAYATIIPGVGHGLAIDPARCPEPTCGGTAGTLLMPWACTLAGPVSNDTACSNCRSCLLASTDHGESWSLGAVSSNAGSREAALVQLDSAAWGVTAGVIYASQRNLGAAPGVRLHAVSLDGGASFNPLLEGADAGLPDVDTGNWTGVVSGLARVTPGGGRPDFLLVTAPSGATPARLNLTTFVTPSVAVAGVGLWAPSPAGTLWPAAAAYSDAVQVNATHVGVLFECGLGDADFAAGIAFAAVPVAALQRA